MTLDIQASLAAQTFAMGERVPLTLAITNSGPGAIKAVDPRAAGTYLRFYLQVPGGVRRTFSMAEAAFTPNAPPIVRQIQCPPDFRWNIELDLSTLTLLNQPGNWSVMLEYDPTPDQKWRSPELPFTILPPAGSFLDLAPDDSARSGSRTLVWAEAEGDIGRILALPMESKTFSPPVVRGAIEIGRMHAKLPAAVSTSPANLPYPDHWLGWVNRRRLFASYWSREPAWSLAPVQVALPSDAVLIRPLLAGPPPDEGRPGCLFGLLWPTTAGSGLSAVELLGDGTGGLLPPVNLSGSAKGGWAVCPSAGKRIFVIALATGDRTEIAGAECPPGEGLLLTKTWYSIEGKYAAGDVRVMPDGQISGGLIVQTGDEWKRVIFRAPDGRAKVEPVSRTVRPGPGARALCARMDDAGGLHWAYLMERVIHYMGPDAEESSWVTQPPAQSGSHFDIALRADPPGAALLYYDSERGPTFMRI